MIRTSRVAADRPRIIPRTLTIPSWLPRMKSDRTVGFGCVARSLAWLEAMAGPSRGTGKAVSAGTRGRTPGATDAHPAGAVPWFALWLLYRVSAGKARRRPRKEPGKVEPPPRPAERASR